MFDGIGVALASSTVDRLTYQAPTFTSGSLVQNRTGYPDPPSNALNLDTSQQVVIQFTGSQFTNDERTVITYGPLPDANEYECSLLPLRTTANMISCTTQGGSIGTGLTFKLAVAGQSAGVSQ